MSSNTAAAWRRRGGGIYSLFLFKILFLAWIIQFFPSIFWLSIFKKKIFLPAPFFPRQINFQSVKLFSSFFKIIFKSAKKIFLHTFRRKFVTITAVPQGSIPSRYELTNWVSEWVTAPTTASCFTGQFIDISLSLDFFAADFLKLKSSPNAAVFIAPFYWGLKTRERKEAIKKNGLIYFISDWFRISGWKFENGVKSRSSRVERFSSSPFTRPSDRPAASRSALWSFNRPVPRSVLRPVLRTAPTHPSNHPFRVETLSNTGWHEGTELNPGRGAKLFGMPLTGTVPPLNGTRLRF